MVLEAGQRLPPLLVANFFRATSFDQLLISQERQDALPFALPTTRRPVPSPLLSFEITKVSSQSIQLFLSFESPIIKICQVLQNKKLGGAAHTVARLIERSRSRKGQTSMAGDLRGTTSERLLRKTTCPVAIVRVELVAE
jgi:hypothetical protein